jgi:uncharacterized membrane protein YgcG
MKSSILLLALTAIVISSCTTAYKTGQTPDDVYFSPVRPEDEYVRTDRNDDNQYRNYDEYYDNRYLRMKVHNRTRWSELDDWYYYGNRYNYTFYNSYYWSNPWSPYTYWNNYFNPYYTSYVIINPKNTNPYLNKPRTFNLNTYNSNMLVNNNYVNPKSTGKTYSSIFNYKMSTNTSSRDNNAGGFLRNLFSGGNSGNSSGGSKSSTSSSSSSGSSSSGSSSAPVRRF